MPESPITKRLQTFKRPVVARARGRAPQAKSGPSGKAILGTGLGLASLIWLTRALGRDVQTNQRMTETAISKRLRHAGRTEDLDTINKLLDDMNTNLDSVLSSYQE